MEVVLMEKVGSVRFQGLVINGALFEMTSKVSSDSKIM